MKTAIVTAGGTIESIDDVRLMSMRSTCSDVSYPLYKLTHFDLENISKGSFGKAIAYALAANGVKTTLIGRHDLVRGLKNVPKNLDAISFRSTVDLVAAIKKVTLSKRADYFFMAAAVSDYSPIPTKGKISSDKEELTIRLKKNPKILDGLRRALGSQSTLIGFKLLSGVSTSKLVEVAQMQNQRANLNFTVANDLKVIDFEKGIHPIEVVDDNGLVHSISGERANVARQLVSIILNQKH